MVYRLKHRLTRNPNMTLTLVLIWRIKLLQEITIKSKNSDISDFKSTSDSRNHFLKKKQNSNFLHVIINFLLETEVKKMQNANTLLSWTGYKSSVEPFYITVCEHRITIHWITKSRTLSRPYLLIPNVLSPAVLTSSDIFWTFDVCLVLTRGRGLG